MTRCSLLMQLYNLEVKEISVQQQKNHALAIELASQCGLWYLFSTEDFQELAHDSRKLAAQQHIEKFFCTTFSFVTSWNIGGCPDQLLAQLLSSAAVFGRFRVLVSQISRQGVHHTQPLAQLIISTAVLAFASTGHSLV